MARIAIVGAGVGGLVAALELARKGHDVVVHERSARVGGKLSSTVIDGYSFDTGPSLLTLPEVFIDLGIDFEASRLEHPYRYHFADGSVLDTFDDAVATAEAFEHLAPGSGVEWKSMYKHGRRIWEIAERSFFSGPMHPLPSVLSRLRTPFDLTGIDPLRTLSQRGERLFSDPRTRQWYNRFATYSGSSPFRAPATLGCIPYIEQRYGCWHVPGGLGTLADALARAAAKAGADIRTNSEVQHIHAVNQVIHAVTANGERERVDAVIANADAEHLYNDLFPSRNRRQRVQRAGRSSSGFALLLGLRKNTPNLAHHNVWFSRDQRGEFDQIFSGNGVASDPTIYVCCSSVTDPSQAPEGCENWFVLVNVGAGAKTDWPKYAERIIERLGVGSRVAVQQQLTPTDWEARYRAPGGAIYGSSSNGRRSAFLRADNRGPAKGLYLAGGSAHPGGGLPLVAMSGSIAARLVLADQPWR